MSAELNNVFFALADPTRRAILSRLATGPAKVGELGKPFEMSKPAISKHMKILDRAGLIERSVVGREHHCRLHPQALKQAEDWLNYHREFWEARLDELDNLLTKQEPARDEP
ncbi:MAG: ArsR/SmtB family transcription factor [Candidatus Rariloculaceae bacterium]